MAEALAKALPAALAAQGRAETQSAIVNKHTVLTSTVSTLDSDTVTDRGPAVGAPSLRPLRSSPASACRTTHA